MLLSHLIDLLLLGQDYLERLSVPEEGLAPLGEAASCFVSLANPHRIERLTVVDTDASDCVENLLRDLILVVSLELLEELDVCHSFLCHGPIWFLVAEVEEDAFEGEEDVLCRRLRRLQVRDVVLAKRIDDLFGLFEVRPRLRQLLFCLLLDEVDLFSLSGDFLSLDLCFSLILLRIDLVLSDEILLLLRVLSLLIESWAQLRQRHLELSDLLRRPSQVIDTRGQPLYLSIVEGLHLFEIAQIQIDAIKEALWCDIRPSPQLQVELFCGNLHTLVHDWEHFRQCRLLLL